MYLFSRDLDLLIIVVGVLVTLVGIVAVVSIIIDKKKKAYLKELIDEFGLRQLDPEKVKLDYKLPFLTENSPIYLYEGTRGSAKFTLSFIIIPLEQARWTFGVCIIEDDNLNLPEFRLGKEVRAKWMHRDLFNIFSTEPDMIDMLDELDNDYDDDREWNKYFTLWGNEDKVKPLFPRDVRNFLWNNAAGFHEIQGEGNMLYIQSVEGMKEKWLGKFCNLCLTIGETLKETQKTI